MSDHDALVQAILHAPDDDAPRLVFADWLDENGDADRAEFIRVQCRLARLPFYDPEHPASPGGRTSWSSDTGRPGASPTWPPGRSSAAGSSRRWPSSRARSSPGPTDLYRQAPIRWVEFTARAGRGRLGLGDGRPTGRDRIRRPAARPGRTPGSGSSCPGSGGSRLVGLMECIDFLAGVACPRLEALDLTDSPAAPVVLEEFCHRAELGRVRALALGAGERPVYQQRMRCPRGDAPRRHAEPGEPAGAAPVRPVDRRRRAVSPRPLAATGRGRGAVPGPQRDRRDRHARDRGPVHVAVPEPPARSWTCPTTRSGRPGPASWPPGRASAGSAGSTCPTAG